MAARTSGWRRVAAAIWGDPEDPQIYGMVEVEGAPILEFIEGARRAGHHVTVTHLVGRAIALALRQVPELNVRIRGGREYPRKTVDVFFITAVAGGHDLSGVKVAGADQKPAVEIASELSAGAGRLRSGKDPGFARAKQLTDRLPPSILRPVLRFGAWRSGQLAKAVPIMKVQPEPFGSAMVSSVGMFGMPSGFAPLSWMYHVPLAIVVGSVQDKPVAVRGRVEIHPMLPLTATIDHRYADGWHLSHFFQAFRGYLENPSAFEPAQAPPRPVEIAGEPAHA